MIGCKGNSQIVGFYGRLKEVSMKRCLNETWLWLSIILVSLWLAGMRNAVYAAPPVVHAVLFYSPTCPHCHQVMAEDLPPLMELYGDQLEIVVINTATQQGAVLYQAATEYYQVPPEQRGVPLLVVGDVVLMGSVEIPQMFPGIVENGLAADGIDWPDFPGIREILAAEGLLHSESAPSDAVDLAQPTDEPVAEAVPSPEPDVAQNSEEHLKQNEMQTGVTGNLEEAVQTTEQMTLAQRFAQDKAGNTLSVIVLLGMVLLVIQVGGVLTQPDKKPSPWPWWVVPVLVTLGTAVALYMSYVEITEVAAVCGPVGNCNTVQQSSYASLFGLIPIGVIGVVGYGVIGLVWLIMSYGSVAWRRASLWVLWLLALCGALFSIYLTFLEPFVIGASCAWCLSSAVVMSLILWATTIQVAQTGLADGR